VLQARFVIIRQPARFFYLETLRDIMNACIILHNMIIEDEQGENVTEGFFHYEQEEENPHIVLPEKTSCFMEFI
jgi:hypothetical protein